MCDTILNYFTYLLTLITQTFCPLHTFIIVLKKKIPTIALKVVDVSSRQFENQPIVTFSNFAFRCHEDIDHLEFYHLKDVCHMCRRSLNHFPQNVLFVILL